MNVLRDTYLGARAYIGPAIAVVVFCLSFALDAPWLIWVGVSLLGVWTALLVWDLVQVHRLARGIQAERSMANLLSLGDDNPIYLQVWNSNLNAIHVRIVDELPVVLQQRDFELSMHVPAMDAQREVYHIRPLKRGEYHFGVINVFVRTTWKWGERRLRLGAPAMAKVYPSIIQMKAFELRVFGADRDQSGIKKVRRLGHGYEFSDIRAYVQGDDPRTINWKASSRSTELQVNNYQQERSQQIYTVINTGRVMRMPFNGLSLVDYSVNASLALQNIVLQNQDHAGLITFSGDCDFFLRAERKPQQLRQVLEHLYRVHDNQDEANYQALYEQIRQQVRGRSLLVLFTNFMSMHALRRAMPVLKKLNRMHLVTVIFFENTELEAFQQAPNRALLDVFSRVIAEKLILEQQQVVYELRNAGIQAMQTRPEDLCATAINKYLELKSRGMI